jgi:hypothetical protein
MNLDQTATGTSLQSRDQDVSLRQRVEDLSDEEFDAPFPFVKGASSGRAASHPITSCPLSIVLSHRAPHRSPARCTGGTRCSSASTLLHCATESSPFSARSRITRMMRRQAAGDSSTARTWSSSAGST